MSSVHEKPMIRWHLNFAHRNELEKDILLNVKPHVQCGEFRTSTGDSEAVIKWAGTALEARTLSEKKRVLSSFLSYVKSCTRLCSLVVPDVPICLMCTMFTDDKAIFVFTEDQRIKPSGLAGIGVGIADIQTVIGMIGDDLPPEDKRWIIKVTPSPIAALTHLNERHLRSELHRSVHGLAAVYCCTLSVVVKSFPEEKRKPAWEMLKYNSTEIAAACLLMAHSALAADESDLYLEPGARDMPLLALARLSSIFSTVTERATCRFPFEGRLGLAKIVRYQYKGSSGSDTIYVDELHGTRMLAVKRMLAELPPV